MEENVQIMKEKRDYVLGELEKMEGVSVAMPPNGAFYVLPDVSGYFGGDDAELCLELLKAKDLSRRCHHKNPTQQPSRAEVEQRGQPRTEACHELQYAAERAHEHLSHLVR